MPANAWFIYALGGGWGHLNRALALAQVAVRHRPVHLLVNSPYAKKLVPALQPNSQTDEHKQSLTLHILPKTELPTLDAIAAAKRTIQSKLEEIDYSCLIVDTFPRGLIGELIRLIPQKQETCRVLVHRDLDPYYVKDKDLDSFVSNYYDGILIPGESNVPFIHLSQAQVTAPWLSRSPTDLISQPLPQWHFSAQKPLVVVCAAGQPDELNIFGHLTYQLSAAFPHATVRCLAATCPTTCPAALWLFHWPGMDVLQFADVVVGSGGYNLVHECEALHIPLVAFAFPRRYDRQERRIRQYGGCLVTDAEGAIAAVRPLVTARRERPKTHYETKTYYETKTHYENGVSAAIAHIEAWCKASRSWN
ncbi:MAG: hypothetical protein AB8B99_12490 [Phormidesmis sp.]